MNHTLKVGPCFDDDHIVANGKEYKLLKYIGTEVSKWIVSLHFRLWPKWIWRVLSVQRGWQEPNLLPLTVPLTTSVKKTWLALTALADQRSVPNAHPSAWQWKQTSPAQQRGNSSRALKDADGKWELSSAGSSYRPKVAVSIPPDCGPCQGMSGRWALVFCLCGEGGGPWALSLWTQEESLLTIRGQQRATWGQV